MQRKQRSNCQHLLDNQESKAVPENHLLLLHWLCQSLWLCGPKQTGKLLERWEYLTTWPAFWEICMQVRKTTGRTRHRTTNWFQTGKGVHQSCILSPCLFNLYEEHIRRMLGWMNHKLDFRLPGEISIISDMQMTPPLWQKAKKN